MHETIVIVILLLFQPRCRRFSSRMHMKSSTKARLLLDVHEILILVMLEFEKN
jgi:hypothetical protein